MALANFCTAGPYTRFTVVCACIPHAAAAIAAPINRFATLIDRLLNI
jgi:hypothetical protein